jgi:hypothetical protein
MAVEKAFEQRKRRSRSTTVSTVEGGQAQNDDEDEADDDGAVLPEGIGLAALFDSAGFTVSALNTHSLDSALRGKVSQAVKHACPTFSSLISPTHPLTHSPHHHPCHHPSWW